MGHGPSFILAAALMIVDFIFLALTLFKVWQFRRYTSGDLGTTMRVILRDGVLYFGVIFAVHLLNAIFVLQQANKQLQPINAPFAVMITSVLTSRLCLNLRRERDMDSLVNLDITQPPEMSMVGMGEWDGGRRGSMSEADAAAAEEGDLGNASMTSATRFGTVNMLSRTVTHALSERSIRDPFRDQSGADADGDRIDKDAGGDLCANEKASASGENSGGGSSARSSRSQDQDRRGYPNAFINHAPVQLHDQAQAREAGNEPWTHTRAGSSVKLQSKPHTGLQVEALALSGPARPALRPRSETVAKTGEGNGECFGSGRARAE